jgi:hypothetical protein
MRLSPHILRPGAYEENRQGWGKVGAMPDFIQRLLLTL